MDDLPNLTWQSLTVLLLPYITNIKKNNKEQLHKAYYVPDTVLSILHILTYLILTITWTWYYYYILYFKDKTQGTKKVICPESPFRKWLSLT